MTIPESQGIFKLFSNVLTEASYLLESKIFFRILSCNFDHDVLNMFYIYDTHPQNLELLYI